MAAIDISYAQGVVDFDRLATDKSIDLVIIQATHGTAGVDVQFRRNWTEAKRVGLRRAAYAFAYPAGPNADDDAVQQATHFYNTVVAEGLNPDDELALDLEVPGGSTEWAAAFLNTVKRLSGRTPAFYSDLGYINEVLGGGDGLGPFSWLWLAAYQGQKPKCPAGWPVITLWQFTSNANVPGVAGNVDEDAEEQPIPTSISLPFLGGTMDPEFFVRWCYATILVRDPDPSGLGTFVAFFNQHGPAATFTAILDSTEGQSRQAQRRRLLDSQAVANP